MVNRFLGKIKIDKKVNPIPFKDRKAPKLIENEKYFVCFGNNNVYPCTLVKIINEYEETEVEVEIPMKLRSK